MWEQGIITTDEGEVIAKPGITFGELQKTKIGSLGKSATNRDNPDYQTLWFGPMPIAGNEFSAVAYFHGNRLRHMGFGLTAYALKEMFEMDLPTGHDSNEIVFYRELVKHEVGRYPPMEFPWGRIGADFDARSNDAGIYFKYI